MNMTAVASLEGIAASDLRLVPPNSPNRHAVHVQHFPGNFRDFPQGRLQTLIYEDRAGRQFAHQFQLPRQQACTGPRSVGRVKHFPDGGLTCAKRTL